MSEEWRALPEERKLEYKKLELEDKEKYIAAKSEWDKSNKNSKVKAPETKSKKKAEVKEEVKVQGKAKTTKAKKVAPAADEKSNGPKRSTSAFFYYQAERRASMKAENPTLSHKEIVVVRIT